MKITYDEVEKIILDTEPAQLSDHGDKIWTRRMAVALADRFNAAALAVQTQQGVEKGPEPCAEKVGLNIQAMIENAAVASQNKSLIDDQVTVEAIKLNIVAPITRQVSEALEAVWKYSLVIESSVRRGDGPEQYAGVVEALRLIKKARAAFAEGGQ